MNAQCTVWRDTRQQFAKFPSGACSILFAVRSIPERVANVRRNNAGMRDIVIAGTRGTDALDLNDEEEVEEEDADPAPHALE
jgi:hypothetical protein